MREIERAYAAGFFDGEGTVGIRVENRLLGARVHVLQLGIGSTDPAPLYWLREHFGGGVRGPLPQPKEKRKPIYSWQLSASKAEEFLRAVRPYLIVKAAQADTAFELRATRTRQGVRLPAAVLEQRDQLKGRMALLNRRGVLLPAP